MNDFGQLMQWVERLERRLKDHEAATRAMFRVGPVVDRDKDKGVRIQSDEGNGADGEPHKEPWGQPAERSGIERFVPRKGQHAMMIAPYGDSEQGIVLPYGHNDANPNPATDVDETVIFNLGKIRLSVSADGGSLIFKNDKCVTTWSGDTTTIEIDGNKTTYTKDQITFPDGSKVHHGDRNVGKDHVHSGVQSGGAKTQAPDA